LLFRPLEASHFYSKGHVIQYIKISDRKLPNWVSFLRWPVIFVGPKNRTYFMSPCWILIFVIFCTHVVNQVDIFCVKQSVVMRHTEISTLGRLSILYCRCYGNRTCYYMKLSFRKYLGSCCSYSEKLQLYWSLKDCNI
jgi:hypothetical protein